MNISFFHLNLGQIHYQIKERSIHARNMAYNPIDDDSRFEEAETYTSLSTSAPASKKSFVTLYNLGMLLAISSIFSPLKRGQVNYI